MKLQHFLRKFDGLGSGFRTVLFVCLTFSYHVRLQNSTLKPIRDIVAAAGDHALVHKRISKYVVGKQEEMKHVRVAGTIAAAATIGVFSWPDVVNTFWIARAFWFMGMILSFFALISSHQDRLIEALLPLVKANPSVEDTKKAFSLVLWMSYPEHAPLSNSADQVCLTPRNLVAIYVWQSAIMHMSWSWVAFLSGLTLHVIKVFLPENDKDSEKKIAICYLVILFVDISVFLGTGIMLHHILKDAERDAGRNAVDVQPAHMGLAASVVDGVSRSASTLIVETKA